MKKEKRTLPRINTNANCVVKVDDGVHSHKFNGVVHNITSDGICICLEDSDEIYDIVRNAISVRVQIIGSIQDTFQKEKISSGFISKWIARKDGQILLGGLY